MSLPNVTITIQDGSLGQVPASNANIQVKMGVCSLGIVGLLYSFGDINTAQATLGQGPLLEAVSLALAVGGGPVYAMPLNPTTFGTSTASPTKVSPTTSAGTLATTVAPASTILIKIVTGGTPGTFTFQYSVGGAAYSANVASTTDPFTYVVPGTLTKLAFANQTYTTAAVWTINTDGTISLSGTGTVSWVTQTSSPLDAYAMQVVITTAGALGAAQFTYSLDGGNIASGQTLVPSGGVFVVPSTGVVLTFASTFGLNDSWSWSTTTASFSNGDVTTGLTSLLANAATWGWVHIVGMPTSAANSASLAATVDAQTTVAETAFRFVFGVVECPTTESDSTVATAFAAYANKRIMVCAGTALTISPLTGRQLHRAAAWAVTARLGKIVISEEPSFVGRDRLDFVVGLTTGTDRDENATPFLDAARFCTLRYFPGRIGVYVTRGNMMASPGSDFNLVSRIRVMNVACSITRSALLPYVNGTVRIDPKTGFIDERDAQAIERVVNGQLKAAIVNPGYASSSSVVLSRSANILSTRNEPVTVRIVPLGILETLSVNIGYSNPALAAA